MTISNCNGLCVRDRDTGETFCPACGSWIGECPKKSILDHDEPGAYLDTEERLELLKEHTDEI